MTNKEIFRIWAPLNKKWVDWVRPVPFVSINETHQGFRPSGVVITCLDKIDTKSTAIIVDLPNDDSVEAGILLAQNGYRPIPIYNGVQQQKGARATTNNEGILSALVWGASILKTVKIDDNAPPAFLIDSNRLHRWRIDLSIFDNSWDVYPQDIPSEDYFLKNGIDKILIIGRKYPRDLKAIIKEWPKKQVSVYVSNGYDEPKCVRKAKNKKEKR